MDGDHVRAGSGRGEEDPRGWLGGQECEGTLYNNDGKLRVSMLRGADRQHLIQFDCDTVQ